MSRRRVGRGKLVAVTLREPIYGILEQLAKDLGFPNISALLNWIVRDWLEHRGILVPAPKPAARPPAAGREGALGQGGPTRGNEPLPVEAAGVRGDAG
jgi:hypothetical protein